MELAQQIGCEVGQQVRAELRQHENERRAYSRQQARNAASREMGREALGMYLACIAGYGFILGFIPVWATGAIGLLVLTGAAFGALMTILHDQRRGANIVSSFLILGVTGVVVFGLVYGIKWYSLDNLLNNGPLL